MPVSTESSASREPGILRSASWLRIRSRKVFIRHLLRWPRRSSEADARLRLWADAVLPAERFRWEAESVTGMVERRVAAAGAAHREGSASAAAPWWCREFARLLSHSTTSLSERPGRSRPGIPDHTGNCP